MGKPSLWLDSNVARSVTNVRVLVEKARSKGIRVVVPAQVHLEICRHMREKTGPAFSPHLIDTFLEQQGIEVIGAQLDRATAETWAELLNRRYPTGEQWKEAKRASVKAKLPDETVLPARVPMTTDWWVALAVEQDADAFIAVEDKGEEWRALRAEGRAGSFNDTLKWLDTQHDTGNWHPTSGTTPKVESDDS